MIAMPATPTPTGYRIRLNLTAWHAIRKARKLNDDAAVARRIGVNRSQLHRVQAGDRSPGPQFIGGVLALLGYPPRAVGDDPRCLFVVEAVT